MCVCVSSSSSMFAILIHNYYYSSYYYYKNRKENERDLVTKGNEREDMMMHTINGFFMRGREEERFFLSL